MSATTCPTCAVTYRTGLYDACPKCQHAYAVKTALLAFSGRPAVDQAVSTLPRTKAWAYGSALPFAKLTEATVKQARIDYAKAQREEKADEC